MKQIYQQTPEEVLKYVNSRKSGLTGEEVKKVQRSLRLERTCGRKKEKHPADFL